MSQEHEVSPRAMRIIMGALCAATVFSAIMAAYTIAAQSAQRPATHARLK